MFSIRIHTKIMIAADLNLAVPRRLGELGQSSHGLGGRHGIGQAKTHRALANSRAKFIKRIPSNSFYLKNG